MREASTELAEQLVISGISGTWSSGEETGHC